MVLLHYFVNVCAMFHPGQHLIPFRQKPWESKAQNELIKVGRSTSHAGVKRLIFKSMSSESLNGGSLTLQVASALRPYYDDGCKKYP